jgi:hypothetical protein
LPTFYSQFFFLSIILKFFPPNSYDYEGENKGQKTGMGVRPSVALTCNPNTWET